jgi:hypothetical protein
LPHPELHNLDSDPDESYDAAPENPQIVQQLQSQIAEMIRTFPESVQKPWADTQGRKALPTTPICAWPRPAGQVARPRISHGGLFSIDDAAETDGAGAVLRWSH